MAEQEHMDLTVHDTDGNPIYRIVIETDFSRLAQSCAEAGLAGKKVCIVADSATAPLYAAETERIFSEMGVQTHLFVFEQGEEQKTLDTVRRLYTFLIEKQFERKDFLAALGGGVVGDLTGFTAATYLRGIPFIQIPTTLLAQSDSSIGGKTGVDFDGYKNMVGAFYMPKLVYMNVSTLQSLDERVFLSGMGEVVKHGFIQDREFLDYLLSHAKEIRGRVPEVMKQVVSGNCRIKRAVVEEDPTEKGLRRILNFGHTLGHAIEKQRAGSLYHGECVAVGMAGAAYMSQKRGYLTENQLKELEDVLRLFGLPVRAHFDVRAALLATKNDKKMQDGSIRFVLLRRPGEAYVDDMVTLQEMEEALRYICLKKEEE